MTNEAGKSYTSAELFKRGIQNRLVPEGHQKLVQISKRRRVGYIHVIACHPDRGSTFLLKENHEGWTKAADNRFVIFVWLGSAKTNGSPSFWLARKNEVGVMLKSHSAHNTHNWERRFGPKRLDARGWKNNWKILKKYVISR